MAFKVHVEHDGSTTTTEHRSVTAARRTMANGLQDSIENIARDDSLWAPRTISALRRDIGELAQLTREVLKYDGLIALEDPHTGAHVSLENVPEPETTGEKRAKRRAVSRGDARWLDSARFANDCACGCGKRVEQGERTYYVPGTGVYLPDHAPVKAAA